MRYNGIQSDHDEPWKFLQQSIGYKQCRATVGLIKVQGSTYIPVNHGLPTSYADLGSRTNTISLALQHV